MTVRLLAVAASLRRESLNRRLLGAAVAAARSAGAHVTELDFRELVFPYYDGDVQSVHGIPVEVQRFGALVAEHDGLLLASPEYNYTLPGTLKNSLDWLSRIRPVPLRGKWALLLAASNGPHGGVRGLWQLRIPLEGLGTFVHPDMFPLPHAASAFAPDGGLADAAAAERLGTMVAGFVRAVGKAVA